MNGQKFLRSIFSLVLSAALISPATVKPIFAMPGELPTGTILPPDSIGYLAQHFNGDPNKKVILIQDLHAHLDTQRKIMKLLEFYDGQGLLQRPVGIEAAFGTWDLTTFSQYPLKEQREALFDYLLQEAGLTGPERFALQTGRPKLLWGIDSLPDYMLQRELYRRTRMSREILARQIAAFEKALVALERHQYRGRLASWNKATKAFEAGTLPGDTFLKKMADLGARAFVAPQTPTLQKVLHARTFADMAELSASDQFYTDVRAYAQEVGVALCHNDLQRALVRGRYTSGLLRRLFSQQLTLAEIQLLASHQKEIAGSVKNLIDASGQPSWFDLSMIVDTVRASTDFYVSALVRDAPLAANAIALLQQPRTVSFPAKTGLPETAIVVVGGFHTDGITEALKKRGISYDLITPNITAEYTSIDEQRYAARLSGQAVSIANWGHPAATPDPKDNVHLASSQAHTLLQRLLPGQKISAVSMVGSAAVAWLAKLRREDQSADASFDKVFRNTIGFHVHTPKFSRGQAVGNPAISLASNAIEEGHGQSRELLAQRHPKAHFFLSAFEEFERNYPEVRQKYGNVREIRVLTGPMDADIFTRLQASGDIAPYIKLDTIGHTLVLRETLPDGNYRVWLHENAVSPVEEYLNPESPLSSIERRALIVDALLHHESTEIAEAGSSGRTHEQLVADGATFETLAENFRDALPSAFMTSALSLFGFPKERVLGKFGDDEGGPDVVTAKNFVSRWVPSTMNLIARGKLKGLQFLYNFKKMNDSGTQTHRRDDEKLQNKYGGHIGLVETAEDPGTRDGDLPGLIGMIGDYKAKHPGWPNGDTDPEVVVPEGGFKTRAANETLSWGFTGLPPVPGPRYRNMREVSFINTLALMQIIPDGVKRFLGMGGGDNMIFAGAADIGGIPLGKKHESEVRKKLEKVSVLFGGSRVEILQAVDIQRLHGITSWEEASIEKALGQGRDHPYLTRWEEIKQQMKREKLFDLGMFRANKAGYLTGFAEKLQGDTNMLRFLYESAIKGEDAFKNPFHQYLDKRFAGHLYQKMVDKGYGELWASYYQVIYQSHFISMDEWKKVKLASYKGPELTGDQQAAIKTAVDELWAEEAAQGRGEILVLNYGRGHNWLDIGDLKERYRLGTQVANSQQIRTAFGIQVPTPAKALPGQETSIDRDSVIGAQLHPDKNGVFIERVIATGDPSAGIFFEGPRYIGETGTYLRNVQFLNLPAGLKITIRPGTIITDSVFDFNVLGPHGFVAESGAMIEGVFATPETKIDRVIARSDERVTSLHIDEHWVLHSSPISMAYKSASVGKQIGPNPARDYSNYRAQHPTLLPLPYGTPVDLGKGVVKPVQDIDFIQMPYPELGNRNFSQAQLLINYSAFAQQADANTSAINAQLESAGLPASQQIPEVVFSKKEIAYRMARVGSVTLLASIGLIVAWPILGALSFAGLASFIVGMGGVAWSFAQIEKINATGDATYDSRTGNIQGVSHVSQLYHEFWHAALGNQSANETKEERLIEYELTFVSYVVRSVQTMIGKILALFHHLQGDSYDPELTPEVEALRRAIKGGTINVSDLGLLRLGESSQASNWYRTALINVRQISRVIRADAYDDARRRLYARQISLNA